MKTYGIYEMSSGRFGIVSSKSGSRWCTSDGHSMNYAKPAFALKKAFAFYSAVYSGQHLVRQDWDHDSNDNLTIKCADIV